MSETDGTPRRAVALSARPDDRSTRRRTGHRAGRQTSLSAARPSFGAEFRSALFTASGVAILLAAAMLVAGLADLLDGDGRWREFAIAAGVLVAVAVLVALVMRGPAPPASQRFGFLLVTILWASVPVAGALPFYFHGLSMTDAVFESVSGFTTTGSTVMIGLDSETSGILLWRSLTQWIGGVGILALGLILLPYLRIGGMQLFNKESSERGDKPTARFSVFARLLLLVYLGVSLACLVAYDAAGMSGFDALNHAMTTVSTGGYSTHDASFGYFEDDAILWVGAVFMTLGGLPFSLFVALFVKGWSARDPQAPVFLAILAVAGLAIAAEGAALPGDRAFAEAVFNATSLITTTGFAAGDYTRLGPFVIGLAFFLTFLGGCAGSTAGGVKTYRLIVVWAMLRSHLARLVNPNAVTLLRYGGRVVDPVVFRAALVFLIAFFATLSVATLALTATGLDFLTALSGALTALTNVGPGIGDLIGPAGNFAALPDAAKWLLSLSMLLGRLEILPVLVLLTPEFWRR